MPIYAEVDSTIDVGPLTDAADELVVGATVTASLLRGATEVWSGEGTTNAAGEVSIPRPDLVMVEPGTAPGAGEVVRGEILTERVEIVSGTLNATYKNELRVRKRRG